MTHDEYSHNEDEDGGDDQVPLLLGAQAREAARPRPAYLSGLVSAKHLFSKSIGNFLCASMYANKI